MPSKKSKTPQEVMEELLVHDPDLRARVSTGIGKVEEAVLFFWALLASEKEDGATERRAANIVRAVMLGLGDATMSLGDYFRNQECVEDWRRDQAIPRVVQKLHEALRPQDAPDEEGPVH